MKKSSQTEVFCLKSVVTGVVLLGFLLLTGCDRSSPTQVQARTRTVATPADKPASTHPASESVPEGMKVCFNCNGSGHIPCVVPTCDNGIAECPGPCLKLSKGKWEHMQVDGHLDTEIWQK